MNLVSGNATGNKLGAKARSIASSRNTVGSCYAAVADAIDATVARFLSGSSAYMAADQLKNSGYFNEVSVSDLRSLPAGAVVACGAKHLLHPMDISQ